MVEPIQMNSRRFPATYHRSAIVFEIVLTAFIVAVAAALFWLQVDRVLLPALVIAMICLLAIVYPQFYEVDDTFIRFRSGWVTLGRVKLSEIIGIKPGKGWPASHTIAPLAGVSFQKRRGRFFAIPVDPEGLIREVKYRRPELSD